MSLAILAERPKIESAGGLPASWYFDPAVLEIEWREIHAVGPTYSPHSPTRTWLRSEYDFDRRIAEQRRDYVEAGLAALDEVTGEDHAAAETLQHGRRALYDRGQDLQGPCQLPMESDLKRFHDCLRQFAADH